EVGELTRTAAAVRTKDADNSEQYSIKYLSFYSGVAMEFSKPERLLTSVELLVNWSIDDLKSTFGSGLKRGTVNGQKLLDFGTTQTGQKLVAMMDGNGNVRSVRFSKAK